MLLVQLVLRYLLFITMHGGLLYFNPHDFKETPMYKPTPHTQAPSFKKTPRDPFKRQLVGRAPTFQKRRRPSFSAQKILWKWSRRDLFRINDSFEHIAIPGSTGSSKTTASLCPIVQAYAEAGYGGLLNGPKANFAETMERTLSKAGALNRSKRLRPGQYGINLIRATADAHGSPDGMEENIIDLIFSGSEVVTRTMGVGSNDPFWIIAGRSVGKKLIVLDQADKGSVDVRRLLSMCRSIPRSPQDLVVHDDDRTRRAVLATVERVREKYPVGANYAIDDAINYITVEAPNVGDKALGSIIATLTAYLEPWCDEIVYNAVCKDCEAGAWKLSDLREKGLILINDYPLKEGYENLGALIGAALKRAVQRQLERELKDGERDLGGVMIVLDDAGCYANTDDVKFLQTGREARAAVVWAFHSISVLRDQFGGSEVGLNKVKALLTFFRTIIAHELDDEETGKYLSGRRGQHLVQRPGGSESTVDGPEKRVTTNTSFQWVPEEVIPYWAFSTLARGGEENGGKAETIVIRSRRFKANGGKRYMKVRAFQEPLYHGEDDPPKTFRERVYRLWHRWNDFKGRSMFIWTDLTPRFRIWNGHVPFHKVAGWLFLKPELGKKLLDRWIYFWTDEREIAVYEEARDESRH
jgi:hypothetical protein